MKYALLTFLVLPLLATQTHASPSKKASTKVECTKQCNTTWSQKFHECNGIKECERWATHEAEDCLKTCEKLP
jgi:hypothetical protein